MFKSVITEWAATWNLRPDEQSLMDIHREWKKILNVYHANADLDSMTEDQQLDLAERWEVSTIVDLCFPMLVQAHPEMRRVTQISYITVLLSQIIEEHMKREEDLFAGLPEGIDIVIHPELMEEN